MTWGLRASDNSVWSDLSGRIMRLQYSTDSGNSIWTAVLHALHGLHSNLTCWYVYHWVAAGDWSHYSHFHHENCNRFSYTSIINKHAQMILMIDSIVCGLMENLHAFVSRACSNYSRTSGCDHLSSGTSFPKYQNFLSQITIFGTRKRPRPLLELKVWNILLFLTSRKRPVDR